MAGDAAVSLEVATFADAELLSNLLELYIHDLTEAFPHIEVGAYGRFGYSRLSQYWAEPERRFAFLVKSGGRLAGFVLVTRGSPAVDDPEALDVAEFFVLRQYRRSGVGCRAAFLLWARLPGRWIVRVSERNQGALAFWRNVTATFANGQARETVRSDDLGSWRVFSFDSA